MAELAHGLGQRRLRDAHRLALPERVLAVLHRRYPACSRVRRDGYSDGPTHHPYSDLRRFSISSEMYNTAACFWREVLRRGGFPAIRRILMRLRASPATTPGELVVHHVNPVLGGDFRPIAKRYGFSDHDLVAAGPPPLDPPRPPCSFPSPRHHPCPPARARGSRQG